MSYTIGISSGRQYNLLLESIEVLVKQEMSATDVQMPDKCSSEYHTIRREFLAFMLLLKN